jgi:hypothetical protein
MALAAKWAEKSTGRSLTPLVLSSQHPKYTPEKNGWKIEDEEEVEELAGPYGTTAFATPWFRISFMPADFGAAVSVCKANFSLEPWIALLVLLFAWALPHKMQTNNNTGSNFIILLPT